MYDEPTQAFVDALNNSRRVSDTVLVCANPAMIDAIYALLLVLIVVLTLVGLLTVMRWVDDKVEALVRWHQMLSAAKRTNDAVQAMVREINGR